MGRHIVMVTSWSTCYGILLFVYGHADIILKVDEPLTERDTALLLQVVDCGINSKKPSADRWQPIPSPAFRQGRFSNHPST